MKLSNTQKLSISAMVVALTMLFLYMAAVVPYVKVACVFISGVFIYALLCEGLYVSAILAFLASALLGFVLSPDKTYVALYAVLFGHFAVFKTAMDKHIKNVIVRECLKIIYANFFIGVGLVIATRFLGFKIPADPPVPLWAITVFLQIGIIALDLLESVCFAFYEQRIRIAILPKR